MEISIMLLDLTLEEASDVLRLLNETPTKMGFFPICQKMAAQINAEASKQPTAIPTTDEVVEQLR